MQWRRDLVKESSLAYMINGSAIRHARRRSCRGRGARHGYFDSIRLSNSDSNMIFKSLTGSWLVRLNRWFAEWLATDVRPRGMPRTDYYRLLENLQLADVVLVEGRTRMSGVIQSVTLSSWSHAALYVGRLGDLPSGDVSDDLRRACGNDRTVPLVVEAEIEHGVRLIPLSRYAGEHLRLCRPSRLDTEDAVKVRDYALARIGTPYDKRHIVDLLRFLIPFGALPRRWRSTLFEAGYGDLVKTICSTLIANAFASVRYPILPTMHRGSNGQPVFHACNSRLVTPRDFDYSPYFDVIKFPFFGNDIERYRELEWR